jgi:hypothetical protein
LPGGEGKALRLSQPGFVGTDDMVLARLRAYRDAGVNTVRLRPDGDTVAARLDTLAHGLDLVCGGWPEKGG